MKPDLFDQKQFGALLFDMDGTLLDSLEVLKRVWANWAHKFDLDLETFLPTMMGKQAVTTITELNLPGIDPRVEAAEITAAEVADVVGVRAIGGAQAFLAALAPAKWAIVTSAPAQLAIKRLEAAGIPRPPVLITADDVENGKPSPDCYLLASKLLGVRAHDCLVLEDARAGIEAAEAAGCSVLVISEAHEHQFETQHTTVFNYAALVPSVGEEGLVTIMKRSENNS